MPTIDMIAATGDAAEAAANEALKTNDNPFLSDSGDSEEEERESIQDRVGYDELQWVDVISSEVVKSLKNWGKENGYSSAIMGQIYNRHAPSLFDELENHFLKTDLGGPGGTNPGYYTKTANGLSSMIRYALNWFSGAAGIPLDMKDTDGSSGSRGSGRSGPTAEDIRNQFDIKELTNMVNQMNRDLVFEDHPDAGKLARQYVDAVVATRGEKKIDFATFVEEQISATSRFKSIYRNKPEHLSATQYMAPYMGAARQIASPHEADDIAIAGAQFGASATAFGERLKRTDAVTGSAPFIQELEGRLRNLNSLFKG